MIRRILTGETTEGDVYGLISVIAISLIIGALLTVIILAVFGG